MAETDDFTSGAPDRLYDCCECCDDCGDDHAEPCEGGCNDPDD